MGYDGVDRICRGVNYFLKYFPSRAAKIATGVAVRQLKTFVKSVRQTESAKLANHSTLISQQLRLEVKAG